MARDLEVRRALTCQNRPAASHLKGIPCFASRALIERSADSFRCLNSSDTSVAVTSVKLSVERTVFKIRQGGILKDAGSEQAHNFTLDA